METVALLDDALVRLRAAGAQVVLSSGNHDSAQRLGFASRVMAAGGVHVRTDPATVGRPVLLADRHGPVAIYPLPYLEPALAGSALGLEPDRTASHQQVLTEAMSRVRRDLATRGPGTRSVVGAHAFVIGGEPSDSERDISVGGVAAVPTSVFDGVDYVALGHLHGRTALSEAVRYSGSPIAYSFSEVHQVKGSWLLDLDAHGLAGVGFVPAPVTRPLAVLRGTLDELLADASLTAAEAAYCQVTLTDAARPRSAMERIRARFPHTLMLAFEPEGLPTALRDYTSRVRGRSDLDICCDFVRHVRGGAQPTEDERALLEQALEAVRDADADSPRRATGPARPPRDRCGVRLHRLRLNAFGPFAGTEEVDFDRLGDAGLFLLHGQTGAGKSSVLDAVCYALYGRLPGARGTARPHLRSDHAAGSERAEVTLELTLQGRRLEVTRSPEWRRPKKRGEGTTVEKGSVRVRERVGGRWEAVTARADEAGLLLQDLLGMRLDQFTTVVLLPQGRVRGVPARRRRVAPRAARAAVRHRALLRRRGLAG